VSVELSVRPATLERTVGPLGEQPRSSRFAAAHPRVFPCDNAAAGRLGSSQRRNRRDVHTGAGRVAFRPAVRNRRTERAPREMRITGRAGGLRGLR
jgi:hypothetical protein